MQPKELTPKEKFFETCITHLRKTGVPYTMSRLKNYHGVHTRPRCYESAHQAAKYALMKETLEFQEAQLATATATGKRILPSVQNEYVDRLTVPFSLASSILPYFSPRPEVKVAVPIPIPTADTSAYSTLESLFIPPPPQEELLATLLKRGYSRESVSNFQTWLNEDDNDEGDEGEDDDINNDYEDDED